MENKIKYIQNRSNTKEGWVKKIMQSPQAFISKNKWVVLLIIYIGAVASRVYSGGRKELLTTASVGLLIAAIQITYANWRTFRKPIISLWFSLSKEFEWKLQINIEGSIESVTAIDEKVVRKFIEKGLDAARYRDRKKDLDFSKIQRGFSVYVEPIGMNLKFEKYTSEGSWDEPKSRLMVYGHTLKKYKETKKLLYAFLKVFLNDLEESVKEISEKKYSMQISSTDREFFQKQFVKGFNNVDHFSISQKTEGFTVTVNKRYLEIVSKYRDDMLINANKFILYIQ